MRRHIPHVTILALALAAAACTGSGSADPTSAPTSTTSASPPPPTATTASPALPEASPTPTAEPTPSPSAAATPTAAFTGGIDPPTEAPEGFSEFSVPPPQDLTEEYAAWVLAEIYRAEDELIRMTVDAPDEDLDELPEAFSTALESLYGGVRLENEREATLEAIGQTAADEPFQQPVGSTQLSHIELVDGTQDCLIVQFVEDSRSVIRDSPPPEQLIVLLGPKPEIDASGFNSTPWLMLNRAPIQDVTGGSCS